MPPEDSTGSAMNAASATGALAVDQVERVVELGAPVEAAVGRRRSAAGRRSARTPPSTRPAPDRGRAARPSTSRPPRRRSCRASSGRSRRPPTRRSRPWPACRAASLDSAPVVSSSTFVSPGRQRAERLGEVDHRARQHPGEEVVEPADHLRHDRDDLRVRVPEDGAHLAAREVEHPPARRHPRRTRRPPARRRTATRSRRTGRGGVPRDGDRLRRTSTNSYRMATLRSHAQSRRQGAGAAPIKRVNSGSMPNRSQYDLMTGSSHTSARS